MIFTVVCGKEGTCSDPPPPASDDGGGIEAAVLLFVAEATPGVHALVENAPTVLPAAGFEAGVWGLPSFGTPAWSSHPPLRTFAAQLCLRLHIFSGSF